MVIGSIDDGHRHRRPAKRVGREEACEAAANNYDSVWSLSRHRFTLLSFVGVSSGLHRAHGRSRRHRVVLVEAFAAGSPELALVDVVLLDITGVGLALLVACRS